MYGNFCSTVLKLVPCEQRFSLAWCLALTKGHKQTDYATDKRRERLRKG